MAESKVLDIDNVFLLEVHRKIADLLSQKNYPCIAALKAYHNKDFVIHTYKKFGQYAQRPELRRDLLRYLEEFRKNGSQYLTFWAVFEDEFFDIEENFEKHLWQELSSLTSLQDREADGDPKFSNDPQDKDFCFSIGGNAFFVVGLHPQSSRLSRRFPWPTLIFNVYQQFEDLAKAGLYQPMVNINRKRDLAFQGDINPMVEKHSDHWETIQFSGKKNTDEWRCPFHFPDQTKNSENETLHTPAPFLSTDVSTIPSLS